MQIGFIGLGRMGANMVTRLQRDGHDVVGYDPSADARAVIEKEGAKGVDSLQGLVDALAQPRRVWVMVPAGDPVNETIDKLAEMLDPGDLVIDGGNTNFRESQRHAKLLAEKKIEYTDVGVSGGIWGLKIGYCMMAGGPDSAIAAIKPVLDSLAPPDGWEHVGPTGAGHFVKMVHNGIEYGMLQAYGEGFEIIEKSEFDVDLLKVSHLWNQGSVIRSWLLELAELAFEHDKNLDHIKGYVDDTGEGRWTVLEAIAESVPAPVLTLSLMARFASRQDDSFSAKVVAALRNEFGGHKVVSE